MKQLIILPLCLILLGCSSNHLNNVEEMLNSPVKDKMEYIGVVEEQWDNFHGDGYRIEAYKILDVDFINDLAKNSHLKKFDCSSDNDVLNNSHFAKHIITKHIINGAGYYISAENAEHNEERIIVIDTVNNQLLYSYSYF